MSTVRQFARCPGPPVRRAGRVIEGATRWLARRTLARRRPGRPDRLSLALADGSAGEMKMISLPGARWITVPNRGCCASPTGLQTLKDGAIRRWAVLDMSGVVDDARTSLLVRGGRSGTRRPPAQWVLEPFRAPLRQHGERERCAHRGGTRTRAARGSWAEPWFIKVRAARYADFGRRSNGAGDGARRRSVSGARRVT